MADQGDEGQPEPQHAVKQTPPEVEIVVDATAAKPIQEAEGSKKEGQVDEVSEKKQLQLEEVDGSSVPAKYAEAMLAVDDSKGAEVKTITNEPDEKKARPKPASLIKLFRYATVLDWLLMLFGSILAICHGVALPLLMLVFGDLTNAFINRDISQQLAADISNGTIDCSFSFPPVFYNLTVTQFLDATNMSVGFDCSYVITPSSTINDFIMNCFQNQARCLTNGDFISVINIQVFYFLGIAAAVFTAAYFQISLFQTACERQVHKIRLYFYRAILRQEIGWFDANPSGELSSRLSE